MIYSPFFSSLFHSSPASDDKLHLTIPFHTKHASSLCLSYSFCLECPSLSLTNTLLLILQYPALMPPSPESIPPGRRNSISKGGRHVLLPLGSTESSFPSLTGAQRAPCCHFLCVCLPHMFGINLRADTRFELFLDSQHEEQSYAQLQLPDLSQNSQLLAASWIN